MAVKAAAAGRSLEHLLVKAGYEQVKARSAVLQFDDFAVARAAGGPFDRAVDDAADGVITTPEGQEYLRQLRSASERGAFFFAAASVLASGRRPD